MKIIKRTLWLIWFLSTVLLVLILLRFQTIELIFFLAIFALIGNLMYEQKHYTKKMKKIHGIIKNIELSPIENGIKSIENNQTELRLNIAAIKEGIENYKIEQENKYRDVVRKVIELENELNKKFRTLGEIVLKINKELEEED